MRRHLEVALALALIALAGCNRQSKKVIAVIPKGNAHVFWQTVHAGAVAASREGAVDIIWNGPATETDYTGQLKVVDAMINRRVDAIALAPIDRQAMVGVVERANSAGIPVIIFDSGIDTDKFVAQVTTDNYHAGELAGERMAKLLGGAGHQSGRPKSKVAILAVQPGAASTTAREQGFQDIIKKNYPFIEIVDKQYGMAEVATSLTKAENILTGHPDLDGIFASNESSTAGAAQALRDRNSKVKLVGFDWSPSILDDLKSGIIDSVVVQDPFRMGQEAVRLAIDALARKQVAKINNLAPKLIDRDNLNTPEVQAQLNPDLKKYL
ncbi:MAG: sugar ABC transporter substrate-binding protein [Acidobacteria bacterium]|nr:MAG: sugar ABC transporter substrate-binding protein [Acidobacteriota bacterium]